MSSKYFAKYRVTDRLSKFEKERIKRLRIISKLKDLPLTQWSKWELIDLIKEYNLFYTIHCKALKDEIPLSIAEFIYLGRYENESLFEELKLKE